MGITKDQATKLNAAWDNNVKPNIQEHATNIFYNFISAYPQEQAKFKKFRDVPLASLKANLEFKKQALAVVTALQSFLKVVHDHDALMKATAAMAAQHRTLNVLKANFDEIFPVIINYVVHALGDQAAWTTCLNTIKDAITSQQ